MKIYINGWIDSVKMGVKGMKQQELNINTNGKCQCVCTCPHCKSDNLVTIDVESDYKCNDNLNLNVIPIFYITCKACDNEVTIIPDI